MKTTNTTKNNRNNVRAKARIRHRKSYYVEMVSDTSYRILSAMDIARMLEYNPAKKHEVKEFIRFDNLDQAMKYVNSKLGFYVCG